MPGIKGRGGKHATGVASIITAESKSESQVQGITLDANVISIDVTDETNGIIDEKALADGLQMAISEDVDIINMSLGILNFDKEIKKLVDEAISKDIVIVASAGNYMDKEVLYPAQHQGVLAVGAIDKSDKVISPVGKTKKPIVYLPGKNVVVTIGENEYIGAYGTSFSTAICTGMIALAIEINAITKQELVNVVNNKNNVVGINEFAKVLKLI